MAKRRTKRKNNKKAKKRASNIDLAIVALIILSILLCVLIYGKSGIVGIKLNEILGGMMGIIKYILPIGTFAVGIKRDFELLNNICLIKFVLKRPCWNCGMTRAFLSILHFDFETAYRLNHNVVIVFPLTVWMYLYSWYKFIFKEEVFKNDRKG